ncbi:Protein of unknown function [Collimonas sp. OK242]|jgi:hypothetical protein|uniref:DUF3108 domain-containing protein n=1 Tax=Collimonas sp. OK242 TaxID=1798195 RepID=UPI00089C67AD|nr:DUF3108 domain-containing protein [Collimonas sp. OK242]SDY34052.1 Protein of unknown function [Collimonas sp. OK242]
MLSSSVPPSISRYTFSSRRRWLWVLLLTMLLHLLLFSWGSRQFRAPPVNRPDRPIIATIVPLPPVEKPVLLPQAPNPKPDTQTRPKATPKPRPAPAPAVEVPDTPIRETVTPLDDNGPTGPAATGTAAAGAATAPATTPAAQADATPPAGKHYQTTPPPSAELKYDVEALQKGQNYHGGGKITWQTDGGSYTINGEAGALFITVLDFKSEGEINGFGVAPLTYTQKRFRKPATQTIFHRERNAIIFSSSPNSYPRSGGEQDRASVVWQLASIGRGDSTQFSPGAVIDLFVAGPLDAETWRMQIIGQEKITVGGGDLDAWHVIRVPQAGSHEQRLDIWLAPQQDWYPVKLRFTETDGDYLDMSLSKMKRLNTAAAN